jgi:hypothetical protein
MVLSLNKNESEYTIATFSTKQTVLKQASVLTEFSFKVRFHVNAGSSSTSDVERGFVIECIHTMWLQRGSVLKSVTRLVCLVTFI